MRTKIGIGFVCLLTSFLIATTAYGAECAGVKLDDTHSIDGQTLQLNGLGLREATFLGVNVYVAGLYVPEKSSDGQRLASPDVPKHLTLRFVRDVGKEDVVSAYRESFKKNAGSKHGEIKDKVQRFLSWMGAVKEGQRFTFTYLPQKGLKVDIAGNSKGTIEGNTFARVFFLIWLGEHPPNEGLKRGMLGGSCG
jgi:hypothetical protein